MWSPCKATYRNVFRGYLLSLDHHLKYFSFWKAMSPIHSYTELPALLCAKLVCHGFFIIQFSLLVGVTLVQLMFAQSCWWNFTGFTSDITKKYDLIVNSLFLWYFTLILLILQQISLNFRCGSVLYIYPLRLGSTTQHFEWLLFSEMGSMYCKWNLLDVGWSLHLSVSKKENV